MIIGDRTELYFRSELGLAFEWGSDCTCSICVNWGPSVALDSCQVTDLLSWAHTCLWEREGSLRSCRRFRLFLDRLIGGGERWRSNTILRLGLKCGGLESKFGWGPGPRGRSGMGWSCLCLGYKWGVCFGVPSWDTLIHESLFLRDGTTWLWFSTVVRTGIWKMVKWSWLLNPCLN